MIAHESRTITLGLFIFSDLFFFPLPVTSPRSLKLFDQARTAKLTTKAVYVLACYGRENDLRVFLIDFDLNSRARLYTEFSANRRVYYDLSLCCSCRFHVYHPIIKVAYLH